MSNPDRYSCVVVGLGIMGSAALYHLTRRGVRALGIEQFSLGHDRGSSHGPSRAFRTTYEQELYARMGCEALEMWKALESEAGEKLLHLNGLLTFAGKDNQRFQQNVDCLRSLGLPHELLEGPEATRRFNAFEFGADVVACFAEQNGFLCADASLNVMQHIARAGGADILEQTQVQHIEPSGNSVVVHAGEQRILADRVILSAGPWIGRLLADLDIPLKVTREQVVHFSVADPQRFRVSRLPVFVDYVTGIYGFPIHGAGGMKVAADHAGRSVNPDHVDRTVDAEYVEYLMTWIKRLMPTAAPRSIDSAVCLYTSTPDLDFIIDRHPTMQNVVVAGGFSGHGFKFSILIGDILADLVIDGATKRSIEEFRISRFVDQGSTG